jgi:putative phosphoribosyl transferase
VAPPETLERLGREADRVVCLETPAGFMAVGAFYDDFTQVEDETVRELLRRAASAPG